MMNRAKKDITTDTPISIDNYTIKKAPNFDSPTPNKSSEQSSQKLCPPQQLSDNQEINEIDCLEKMYQQLMNQSRYTEGSKLKKVIEQKRSQQKSRSILKIRREHKQQKKYVHLGHRKQLRSLKNSWQNLNLSEQSRKRQALQQFNQFRQKNMKQYEQRVNRRCLSAKPRAIAVKIETLRMQQRALRKQGQSHLLRRIRQEKSQLTKQYKRQYNESCVKIIEQQRRKMSEKEKQRYFAYLNIIERRQTCNRIKYKREQQRLKQKLANVVRKLEHEQKIQISQLI